MKTIVNTKADDRRALVTFGSGPLWAPALRRLARQARRSSCYGKIFIFDESDFHEFAPEKALFISKYPRGYGLWIWKPTIVKRIFDSYSEIEVINYLDAGCELNINDTSIARLFEYFRIAESQGGLAFSLPLKELDWSHPSLVEKFQNLDVNSKQVAGGIFFLKRSEITNKLLEEWGAWMDLDNHAYLTGEGLGGEPHKNFKEHRYDQSIFSLLWKKNALPVIDDESFWHPKWKSMGKNYPIWATRSKYAMSVTTSAPLLFIYRAIRKSLILLSRGNFVL